MAALQEQTESPTRGTRKARARSRAPGRGSWVPSSPSAPHITFDTFGQFSSGSEGPAASVLGSTPSPPTVPDPGRALRPRRQSFISLKMSVVQAGPKPLSKTSGLRNVAEPGMFSSFSALIIMQCMFLTLRNAQKGSRRGLE